MDEAQLEKEIAALAVFRDRFSRLGSADSREAGKDFKLEKDDIVISTPPKSGTTWMQQISHQLRSGGDMEFEEISEVVPFLEGSMETEVSLDRDQRFKPRLFKTHFWEPLTPKGGRYIIVIRHPYDTAVSSFKFMEGWMFEPGEISLETYVAEHFITRPKPGGILHHLASWWPRHADPDVLWVFYEDMKEDLPAQVDRIAAFMGISDTATIAQAVHKSTFAFMKEHESQYNELPLKRNRNVAIGLKPDAGMNQGKVRVGGGQQHLLSDRSKALIDEAWRTICQPVTGAASFAELRLAWKAEQSEK
ncbi:sulfotransferase 1E1-like [Sycon ciliatum]|uniref:sulfotransferase 1E1-like n=1 Tax=Sycon ciliatum TaxID=27933 RepID=UPI0020AA7A39|eukprot:scpid71224/ scgid27061/ Estrogen sulfotransferase; EST-1; Sulfotransferase 1E1; Sulfotransferase, estrogen-preferring